MRARPSPPSPSQHTGPVTPARIYGAVRRIDRTYIRLRADGVLSAVFGCDSATAEALRFRVERLAEAAKVTKDVLGIPMACTLLLLDLANVAHYAQQLHTVAVWFAAAAESIEAGDRHAATAHAELSVIAAECEFIATLADHVHEIPDDVPNVAA